MYADGFQRPNTNKSRLEGETWGGLELRSGIGPIQLTHVNLKPET